MEHEIEDCLPCLTAHHLDGVEAIILDGKLDPNFVFGYNGYKTVLHIAIQTKHMWLVKLLLHSDKKSDLTFIDCHGLSYLDYAVREKQTAMVEELIVAGADVNLNGKALGLAVQSGSLEIFSLLVRHGCDMYNFTRAKNSTASDLMEYVLERSADRDYFLCLLEYGYDIYEVGVSERLFHYAAKHLRLDIMCILFDLIPRCFHVDWLVKKQYPQDFTSTLTCDTGLPIFRAWLEKEGEERRSKPLKLFNMCRVELLQHLCQRARRDRVTMTALIDT